MLSLCKVTRAAKASRKFTGRVICHLNTRVLFTRRGRLQNGKITGPKIVFHLNHIIHQLLIMHSVYCFQEELLLKLTELYGP